MDSNDEKEDFTNTHGRTSCKTDCLEGWWTPLFKVFEQRIGGHLSEIL